MTSQRTLISAFTLNYLDVDVEGMFIPGLDKKMVSILIRCYTWDSPQWKGSLSPHKVSFNTNKVMLLG